MNVPNIPRLVHIVILSWGLIGAVTLTILSQNGVLTSGEEMLVGSLISIVLGGTLGIFYSMKGKDSQGGGETA